MQKPPKDGYMPYFQLYIDQVPENNLTEAFKNQLPIINGFISAINEEKSTYAYAEGKWTLKEMLQHITDTERIFAYRALCVARGDKQSLPGFDENTYAANSNANLQKWEDLSNEFIAVRKTTELLFNSFTPEALNAAGTSNNYPTNVLALGYILIGHFYHHKKVAEERYL